MIERRRGSLLDDLLITTLDAAVTHADRPHGAVGVADDLHLDVFGPDHQLFDENRVVPERAPCLRAGRLEGPGELLGRLDPTDAPTTTAGGGLDEYGIADALGMLVRLLDGLDRTATPCRDRDRRSLGDLLRGDLVAEASHHLGVGADEGDPESLAHVDESGMLGHETPADPHGLGSGVDQGLLEATLVDVAHLAVTVVVDEGGRSDVVGLVGLSHEHRMVIGIGVERDGAEIGAVLGVVLEHRVDESHCRFAAIDDGDAAEAHESAPPFPTVADRRGATRSSSIVPGSCTVR